MKYDISTLLALRPNAHIEIGNFSAQALSNNLLRRRKTNTSVLTERLTNSSQDSFTPPHPSQVLSSTSGNRSQPPHRQPSNPPQGPLAQTDAGFAQFLKEHSSPKHQRVTAGGRIVPMDPVTPVPRMKLPVKKQDANCQTNDATTPTKATRSGHGGQSQKASALKPEINSLANASMDSVISSESLTDPVKPLYVSGKSGQPLQAPGIYPGLQPVTIPVPFLQSNGHPPLNSQQFLPREQQAPEYMLVLPNYAPYSFGAEHAAWLPSGTQVWSAPNSAASFASASSQPQSALSGSASGFSAYNNAYSISSSVLSPFFPISDTLYASSGSGGYQLAGTPVTEVYQQNISLSTCPETSYWKPLLDASQEHESLSAQLSRLDRYMAIHTWDLDPSTKKLLVEHRMSLVRERDAARLRKEQLELIVAQAKANVSDSQGTPTGLPMVFPYLHAGDATNSENVLLPWTHGFAFDHTTAVLPSSALATPYLSMLSDNGPLNAAVQWQNLGDMFPQNTTCHVPGYISTGMNQGFEVEQSYRELERGPDAQSGKQQMQAHLTSSTRAADKLTSSGGWATPTKAAPPEIRRIYRKIEEASRRGDSIEDLLKEIAAVTAKLSRTSGECDGTPRQASRTSKTTAGGQLHNSQSIRNQSSELPRGGNGVVEPSSAKGLPRELERNLQLARRAMPRLWKSEECASPLMKKLRHAMDDEDDDDDSYSSTSSTDSWATVNDADKRWLVKQLKQNEQVSDEQDCLKEIAHGSHERTMTTGTLTSAAGSPTAKKRNAVDCKQSVGSDGTTAQKSHGSVLPSHSSNSGGEIKLEGMRPNCPQFFAHYRNGGNGSVSQKTVALAVPQNINAHAFLPPFDGAGDAQSSGMSSPDTDDYAGVTSNNSNSETKEAQTPWYIKKERPKPDPRAVEELFRRIQWEEEDVIHKYRLEHPESLLG